MVAFVILNYNSFKDTINCINSIRNLKYKNIKIIVVDNNTLKDDEKQNLEKKVDSLYCFNENVGFAVANNKGCTIAKEKYNPDFICVVNSDTEIRQKHFINLIYEDYERYKFDCLGPKILSPSFLSANPFPVYKTLEEVEKRIKYHERLVKIYHNFILRILLDWYVFLKQFIKKPKKMENADSLELNVALHGCFLIFSKQYLQKYNFIFYPKTFLYHEEEFLYYRSKQDNLLMMYDPKLEIVHYEGGSLNKSYKKKYKKLIFKNKEILKSLYLYKEVLTEGGKI